MTREKRAITNLKQMCSDGRYLGSGSYVPLEVLEDFNLAVKALEQEPRKGHWIEYSWNDNGLARWGLECDKCHKKYKYGGEIWHNPNFCPNCGAKMESEEV